VTGSNVAAFESIEERNASRRVGGRALANLGRESTSRYSALTERDTASRPTVVAASRASAGVEADFSAALTTRFASTTTRRTLALPLRKLSIDLSVGQT
jgi:hypothetical protein